MHIFFRYFPLSKHAVKCTSYGSPQQILVHVTQLFSFQSRHQSIEQ
jgi:hypothetical protein